MVPEEYRRYCIRHQLFIEAPLALFTQPWFRAERTTFPVATPTALIGAIESVYSKPEVRYVPERIGICSPLKYITMTVNQAKRGAILDEVCGKKPYVVAAHRIRRRYTFLAQVAYLCDFYVFARDPEKHSSQLLRRIDKGRSWKTPYLGINECVVDTIRLATLEDRARIEPLNIDVGRMPLRSQRRQGHTLEWETFVARVENGWMDVPWPTLPIPFGRGKVFETLEDRCAA